jgi:hypothetical protein
MALFKVRDDTSQEVKCVVHLTTFLSMNGRPMVAREDPLPHQTNIVCKEVATLMQATLHRYNPILRRTPLLLGGIQDEHAGVHSMACARKLLIW